MNIDFVLPWVDGNDPVWQDKKRKYDNSEDNDYNSGDMRYRDWGTLKYVLRGIDQNCPWYNKIYLITEGHYPEWLDIDNGKIVLVTHDELYFDKSHLPVFSSSSIEMNLPNIQGLSEKFVYLNDDMLIVRQVEPERFFMDGKPVDFLSHGWLPRNKIFERLRGMNSWAHSIRNNIELINRKFSPLSLDSDKLYHPTYSIANKISNFMMQHIYKKFIWIEHWHHPQPYLRSTLENVHNEFEEEMMQCSANRFRANNDLTQYIYRYWQLASGNFYPYKYNDGLYSKIETKEDMDKLIAQMDDYTFVCPNDSVSDGTSEEDNRYIEKKLIDKLDSMLPKKASFEK